MFSKVQLDQVKAAQDAQKRLTEEIGKIRIEASAGGGMVSVTMNGHRHVLSVSISPEVASDVEMLEELVRSAFNEAGRRAEAEAQRRITGLMSGMLGGLANLGFGPPS